MSMHSLKLPMTILLACLSWAQITSAQVCTEILNTKSSRVHLIKELDSITEQYNKLIAEYEPQLDLYYRRRASFPNERAPVAPSENLEISRRTLDLFDVGLPSSFNERLGLIAESFPMFDPILVRLKYGADSQTFAVDLMQQLSVSGYLNNVAHVEAFWKSLKQYLNTGKIDISSKRRARFNILKKHFLEKALTALATDKRLESKENSEAVFEALETNFLFLTSAEQLAVLKNVYPEDKKLIQSLPGQNQLTAAGTAVHVIEYFEVKKEIEKLDDLLIALQTMTKE